MLELPPPPAAYLAAEKFIHNHAPNRSARYMTVNSGDVMNTFTQAGLTLRTVVPQKLRKASVAQGRDGLQRHVFRFDTGITLPDNSRLEVLLRNSYDGTTSFGLNLGVFRIVCSNGLIAGSTFLRLAIPHAGTDVWARVQAGIAKILSEGPRMADTIERWRGVRLNDGAMSVFASRVATSMLPAGATVFNAPTLLSARRSDDALPDLWTTFNRLQENALSGGLHYRLPTDPENKVRHTRRIRGSESLFKTNVALWDLANETEAEVTA